MCKSIPRFSVTFFFCQDPSLHTSRASFTDLLEELPTVVVNSKLASIVLKDIVDESNEQVADKSQVKARNGFAGLHLSMASDLEQQLKSLLQRLDNIYELQYTYQRTLLKLGTGNIFTKVGKIYHLYFQFLL